MRKKEGLSDYRYFPEPDLAEVVLTNEYIASMRVSLPELPETKRRRYEEMGLSMQDVLFLANDVAVSCLNLLIFDLYVLTSQSLNIVLILIYFIIL